MSPTVTDNGDERNDCSSVRLVDRDDDPLPGFVTGDAKGNVLEWNADFVEANFKMRDIPEATTITRCCDEELMAYRGRGHYLYIPEAQIQMMRKPTKEAIEAACFDHREASPVNEDDIDTLRIIPVADEVERDVDEDLATCLEPERRSEIPAATPIVVVDEEQVA